MPLLMLGFVKRFIRYFLIQNKMKLQNSANFAYEKNKELIIYIKLG